MIAAVLVLLNTYPLLVSQDLVFTSKKASMTGSVKRIESCLSGLPELTEENVGKAMGTIGETGVSRVLVTDTAGFVLYDTRSEDSAVGKYAFYTEIAEALRGNDAFFCTYDHSAFLSRMAEPVVYHNRIVGAVYTYEYDAGQAELLQSFQSNLAKISLVVALAVVVLSLLLSRVLTGRITVLLSAIRSVRAGAYSQRAELSGGDEIAQIAAEFNSLTDRLQTTEDARRRFVSDASHELKTPLAGICLLTDSILQTEDMDRQTNREFVSDIGREAERLSRITENLLRLTRLDSGAVETAEETDTAVAPVLSRVNRMLRLVSREKGVTLSDEVDESAAVAATEDDVHQILYNLMDNAIKYSSDGGFVHTVVRREGQRVMLRVEDNGIGIPPEERERIFDRFYRVDKMRSRAIGGTGLGLSIVRDTVLARGGTIEAAARGDVPGTVFTVYLPASGMPQDKGGEEQ